MAARVTVVVGPANSGKTARLLEAFRAALAASPPTAAAGSILWLAPGRRAIDDVRGRLISAELPACFGANILTFEHFADRVLDHADDEIRPIDDRAKRLLIERIIGDLQAAGRLKHFAAVADTPGLIELTAAFIADLKRAEIWPEDFEQACRKRAGRRTWPDNDRELHAIYAAYQDRLVEHRLYDDEGRSWAARDRLHRGQQRPFEKLKLVVVDGFTDLTRTQGEILDALAGRAEEVYVGLLADQEAGREELFRRPTRTLDDLRRRFPQLTEVPVACDQNRPAALVHVERQLFKNPREVTPAQDATGIEILAASGRVAEIEQLARRVKDLLLNGDEGRPVKPDDVAVVFRSLDEAASLVREVFARYGLPTAIESGRRLDQSPSLMALAALINLDGDDWPFRTLLAVVGSNYFQPSWPEWHDHGAAEAVEATIRALQLPSGRETLLKSVERWATSQPREVVADMPDAEAAERHNRRRDEAILAWPVLKKLAAAFDQLPRQATAREWSAALEALARETGLWRSLHEADELPTTTGEASSVSQERAAWAKFHHALAAPDGLALLIGEVAAPFGRDRLRRLLEDVIRTEQLPGDHDETGSVRVLSAVTVRNLSIPYVFLAGLTEKSFPNLRRDDALYGEAERQSLIDQGLRLSSAADRFADEMLLFYEAATRAGRRLWLSYPALNEKAEPLLPSPYLVELQELFTAGALPIPEVAELSAVPPAGALTSLDDHRVRAVSAAAHGELAEFAVLVRRRGVPDANLLAGLGVVSHRGRFGGPFGPYEGVIDHPAAKALLARRYDADHRWSAAQLEGYSQCPHRFYLERVLKLRPPEDIDLAINHRRRGSRLHEVVARLHAAVNAKAGRPASPADIPPEEFAELLAAAVGESVAGEDDPVERSLGEIDRRLFTAWLHEYVEQFTKYQKELKGTDGAHPAAFEVSFGLPVVSADGPSTPEPFVMTRGEEQIRITGRIDRIDVGTAGDESLFCVIDYKTGARSGHTKGAIESFRDLQLSLYALAAEKLNLAAPGARPLSSGYWFPGDGGFKRGLKFHESTDDGLVESADWAALRGALVEHVFGLVRDIRRGEFPMFNSNPQCTETCDFSTVCRVRQTRSLEKQWPSPNHVQR